MVFRDGHPRASETDGLFTVPYIHYRDRQFGMHTRGGMVPSVGERGASGANTPLEVKLTRFESVVEKISDLVLHLGGLL